MIRTKTLLPVREARDNDRGDRQMLGFETLTLCPIDRRLIDTALLTRDELQWLDAYHARVLKEPSDLMTGDDRDWLVKFCAPLTN